MADTIPRITVTDQWQAVSVLTGIAAGTALRIQNTGSFAAIAVLSASEPTGTDIGDKFFPSKMYTVAAGESDLWVKIEHDTGSTSLSVQEN